MANVMKIVILEMLLLLGISNFSFSQRILFQSDFENINLTVQDSLPLGWAKLDADSNFFGVGKSWAVRDTTQIIGGDTNVNRPRSNSGKKSLHISWLSGKGGNYIGDDWVWTDSLRIISNDSLIFWSLLGNIRGISFYVDSLQIWICSAQNPGSANFHLTTLVSNLDTTVNTWKVHNFDLSQFSGQRIYIGFRYYLPVEKALWCNIDDMFIGNRSYSSSVTKIGSNIPPKFILWQNYPNPFNPVTIINYDLSIHSKVRLTVYDILGNEVDVLADEEQSAGTYSVKWPSGTFGNAVNYPNGIYYYKLSIYDLSFGSEEIFLDTKKMILLK